MIVIREKDGAYFAASDYADRFTLKSAGFWFHDPRKCERQHGKCFPCLHNFYGWWTPSRDVAGKLAQYAEPGLQSTLAAERSRHEQAVIFSRAKDVDPALAHIEMPAPPGLAYLPYQRAGIAYGVMNTSFILGDQMGLGKTIQVLGIINSDPSIRKVLIFCPSTLRLNWLNEAKKWLVRPYRILVIEERELPEPDDDIVIVNYDKVIGKHGEGLLAVLMGRSWDLLACDEAHKLKNPKAQRTKAVLGDFLARTPVLPPGIASRARRRIIMSGTPFLNSPIEIFPLLATVSPEAATLTPGTTPYAAYWHFANRWCRIERSRFGAMIGGPKGATSMDWKTTMLKFQEMLRGCCMIRRTKDEVLTELPPKTRQIITLAPEAAAAKVVRDENKAWTKYETAIEELRAQMVLAHAEGNKMAYEAAVTALRAATATAFTEISKERHKVALSKVEYVADHVNNMISDGVEKVIVFAHHRDVVNSLLAAFERDKANPAYILGGQGIADVQQNIHKFQNDPECKVIVASIMAAGVGHTLTAASNVVFAELDWVPMNISQAEDRAHRIGQKRNVLVQHLVLDGSLDSKMVRTMIAKQNAFDAGMDTAFEMGIPVTPAQGNVDPPPMARGRINVTGSDPSPPTVVPEPEPSPMLAVPGASKPPAPIIPKKYERASDNEKVAAQKAMQILAGVCNYASTRDGAGFDRMDTIMGHTLAKVRGPYTDGQVFVAKRLARKYKRQLPAEVLSDLGVE